MSTNERKIKMVGIITILINLLLAILKSIVGIISNSSAIISDAIHSASDIFSTIVVLIGSKIAHQKVDDEHPYGHERFESIAAFVLSIMLFFTAFQIAYVCFDKLVLITRGKTLSAKFPILCIIVAIISIVVKAWMYFYTKKVAIEVKSTSLKADAWHHLTDSLSSIASLIGSIGIFIGFTILDPIFGIVICLFIVKVAYDISKESINQLIDKRASFLMEQKIKLIVLNNHQVIQIESLKTRQFGNKIYVDLEVIVNENLTLKEGHKIAHDLHDALEEELTDILHCMVHISPQNEIIID